MFPSKNTYREPDTLFKGLILLVLLIVFAPCHVVAQGSSSLAEGNGINTKSHSAVENLANIQQSLESKRTTARELRNQLKQLEDISDRQALEQKIERINKDITSLHLAFEHIALGGINVSALTDQPEQEIDWRVELEQVSRPLLSTLKELTAKPRQVDNLRRESARLEDQLNLIEKAIESIRHFKQQTLPPIAANPINQLLIDWEQRRDDTQRALEITQFKLTSLKTESTAWYTSTGEALIEFIHGRGLTLLLAILISVVIWLLSKGLLTAYWRWLFRAEHDIGITRTPLIYYSYRLATAIIIVLAILMVFYVRGDVLFLTLALIALAGAALTLRQTLPRYTAELRLLLGVGPVREKERLVLDGSTVHGGITQCLFSVAESCPRGRRAAASACHECSRVTTRRSGIVVSLPARGLTSSLPTEVLEGYYARRSNWSRSQFGIAPSRSVAKTFSARTSAICRVRDLALPALSVLTTNNRLSALTRFPVAYGKR